MHRVSPTHRRERWGDVLVRRVVDVRAEPRVQVREVRATMSAIGTIRTPCEDCSRYFTRNQSESWKTLCLACWRRLKTREQVPARIPRSAWDELPENLRGLMQLCHPDRHRVSRLANKITAWLLRVRRDFETGAGR